MIRLILLIGTASDIFLAFELMSAGENGALTLGELAKKMEGIWRNH